MRFFRAAALRGGSAGREKTLGWGQRVRLTAVNAGWSPQAELARRRGISRVSSTSGPSGLAAAISMHGSRSLRRRARMAGTGRSEDCLSLRRVDGHSRATVTTRAENGRSGLSDSNSPVSQSFQVVVKGAADQITDLHNAVIGVGPGTSLADRLQQAQSDLAAGDVADACSTLSAFIHEVSARSGKNIPPATASQLIADAQRILSSCLVSTTPARPVPVRVGQRPITLGFSDVSPSGRVLRCPVAIDLHLPRLVSRAPRLSDESATLPISCDDQDPDKVVPSEIATTAGTLRLR